MYRCLKHCHLEERNEEMGKIGLPELSIIFRKKAITAIERSERGIVLLLLNDSTNSASAGITAYGSLLDVNKDDWSAKNYRYLQYVFKGKPYKVLAVRGVLKGDAVDVSASKKLFSCLKYDWFAFPECTSEDATALASFFDKAKKENQKKWKAVLPNIAADSPAVVNFTTKNISILWDESTGVETVCTAEYTARIAGLLAGTSLTQSSTYKVLDEVVDAEMLEESEVNSRIGDGELILFFDGEKFKIARGVTSLQTVTETEPEDFKKIKIVEASDLYRTDILDTFKDYYVGNNNNTYDNKMAFIGAVRTYTAGLGGTVVDKDAGYSVDLDTEAIKQYIIVDGKDPLEMEDMEIRKYKTGSHLPIVANVMFLDAMEDLNMTVNM